MVRDYELMYIVRPDLDEEGLAAATQSVQTLLEGQGGEVVRTTPWGKRRLAYEIERMRDGHYVLLHIRLDAAKVKEVERLLHIHDNVFRHLVTLWVDTKGKDEGEDGHGEPPLERLGAGVPAARDENGRAGVRDDADDEPAIARTLLVTGDDGEELDANPAAEEDE